MTMFSPCTDGSVTTRRSMWRPSRFRPTRPSCGQATLGDVEVAHDLQARHDAGDHAPRDGHRLHEHAVDAEAHAHRAVLGLEVDVRGALLDGLGDDLVDELDDRRVVGGLAQVDDLADAVVGARRRSRPWRRRGRAGSGARSSVAMSSREATATRTS